MNAPLRTIQAGRDGARVTILHQSRLPADVAALALTQLEAVAEAIGAMRVRGAPLIGVTAAWGVALALRHDPSDAGLARAAEVLIRQRPTAVNLRWAVERVAAAVRGLSAADRADAAWVEAASIMAEDESGNERIAEHGLPLIQEIARRKHDGDAVQVLTHCNAGWLATTAWGTATAPIYLAHQQGIPVHVWVDETRPRNQGAALTAWELARAGVPHTVIVDNAGGHLMQRDRVDLCLVGADRVAANGDVVNKIGTYLKALAARDGGIPFHVAMPTSTIDLAAIDGMMIPIEERDPDEVLGVTGYADGVPVRVALTAPATRAANPGFDVTPARLVTSLITERGCIAPTPAAIAALMEHDIR